MIVDPNKRDELALAWEMVRNRNVQARRAATISDSTGLYETHRIGG